ETYEYDVRVPGNTPITDVTVNFGATFATATNTSFPESINATNGTVTTIANIDGTSTPAVVISFTYDVSDTVEEVEVTSPTSAIGNDNRTIDLAETVAGSAGTFDQAIGLVTALQLAAIEDAAAISTSNIIGNIGNAPDLLEQVDLVDADGVALALRLDNMLADLGLVDTDPEQDLIDLLLSVSDGDTISVTYSDANPASDRVGTVSADLTPPIITLIGPADGLNVNPAVLDPPDVITFDVQVTDTGAPINVQDDAGTTDLNISGSVDEIKTDVVNGIRLTLAQGGATAALGQGTTNWFVVATDAVGNSVADEPGGINDAFSINIDSTVVASINAASVGFGANAAGTNRTRDDDTGIEVTFSESLDGSSVAATDFNVTGSSVPLDARHFTTLLNTETFTATAAQTQFTIAEFLALDTDDDGNFADEYTVTVNGTSVTLVETNSDNNTAEIAATAVDDVVAVTYTFDSGAIVYLTIAPQASDATPVISLIGAILDLAGNGAAATLLRTATDNVPPTMTVSVDSTLAGDPDDDGDAEVAITILSSEVLAADPTPTATITALAGTHTGTSGAAVLTDASADFVNNGVAVGDSVTNVTDGSTAVVTAVTALTLTAALAGGGDNDWDAGDLYSVAVAAGAAGGALGTLTEVTADTEWTLTFTSNITATFDIAATGNDASPAANLGTADAVSVEADVADPALSAFTPADDDPPNSTFQGLDDIARLVADFGESTTLVSSTIAGANLASITISLGELNDSGQTGTATLTAKGADTQVDITATAGISGIQHIHDFTGGVLGGVIHDLGTLGEDGTSTTLVNATLASLMAGVLAVNLHDVNSPGTYTSRGAIPVAADVSETTFADGNTYILSTVLAEGTYTWNVEVTDDAGNTSGVQSLDFVVDAPTGFDIPIEPGWNLISVPARLDAASMAKVFGGTSPSITMVRTWSSAAGWQSAKFEDGAWSSTTGLLTIKPGLGYWVFSTSAADVTTAIRRLAGVPAAPRPQAVVAGWNLIGPQAFNLPPGAPPAGDDYFGAAGATVWYSFDPDPATGFTRFAADDATALAFGSGYWVWFDADGQIIP
ncbi:MAG: Ig-like domain-containing protein, partial [Dehalococcoidia bacterium]